MALAILWCRGDRTADSFVFFIRILRQSGLRPSVLRDDPAPDVSFWGNEIRTPSTSTCAKKMHRCTINEGDFLQIEEDPSAPLVAVQLLHPRGMFFVHFLVQCKHNRMNGKS